MWAYPEMRLLGDTIAYHARHTPARLAFSFAGEETSFATFEKGSNKVANGLLGKGLGSGHRVIFLGKNSLDFYLALFGATRAGACFVPLNWRLAATELATVVRDAEVHFAIVEREFETTWADVRRGCGADIETLLIDEASTLALWADAQAATAPKIHIRDDDAAILLYTSGTTGLPKGVVHTHASFNHSRLCEHFERAYAWKDGDIFLCPLPNFHLLHIALALQCLYNGVAISIQRQFDPVVFLAGIAAQRPSLLVLTPTMIQIILDHPDATKTDFGSVRLTMYAGSPISLGLIKRAIATMPCQFMQFYGQTETSGPVSLLRADEHNLEDEQKLKSCGRPLPLISLRIVDTEGRDVPDGQPGELLVRAPACSSGYWRQPDQTEARFRSGWYYTGDIAYRDGEGLYYIFDRMKDMIVTGGENVYSAEVETVMSLHTAVAAVAVIGVPDDRWGEAVKAVVVRRPGQSVDPAELISFCRTRLAGYKIPKSVDFIESMPVTATGKVSKTTLRAPYWSGMQRSVA
jgi:acyl-CoA synthetase (AMP-forming)/AMP-acid ligase II